MSATILLATRSAGKLRELEPMFAAAGWRVSTLAEWGLAPSPDEAAVEAFDTFEANALAKAHYFSTRTGLAVVADDSGLEVLALGGAPGVHSKRWAAHVDVPDDEVDEANNAKLLRTLADQTDRRARYVCAAAYVGGDDEIVRRGETAGQILHAPRGVGGFGYDPYFESEELGVTFAEATREAKERVSHRGRAVRALLGALSARR